MKRYQTSAPPKKKKGSENRSFLSHNCHFYFKAWPAVVRTRQEGKVSHILVFNFTASAGVESNLTLRMRLTVSPKNVWDRISPFAANKKIHFVWEKEEATTFSGLLRQLQLLVIDALKNIFTQLLHFFSETAGKGVSQCRPVSPFQFLLLYLRKNLSKNILQAFKCSSSPPTVTPCQALETMTSEFM